MSDHILNKIQAKRKELQELEFELMKPLIKQKKPPELKPKEVLKAAELVLSDTKKFIRDSNALNAIDLLTSEFLLDAEAVEAHFGLAITQAEGAIISPKTGRKYFFTMQST